MNAARATYTISPLLTRWIAVAAIVVAVLAALGGAASRYFSNTHTRLTPVPKVADPPRAARVPRPAHVVVVIEENKSFDDIIGKRRAPYLNELSGRAAVFTRSYGVAHPSQPNYLALFAGRTNGDGDSCNVGGVPADAGNLGAELLAAHLSFAGYAEGLPQRGFPGCTAGNYARKHAPWTHFTSVPRDLSLPFTLWPQNYDALPTVAFLIPDLEDDMHSGSVAHGDAWLRRVLQPLLAWAEHHDTLVIVTWDESNEPFSNHIPTLFAGPMVKPGRYDEIVSHYRVLRTLEDAYGLPHAGASAEAPPIVDCWR